MNERKRALVLGAMGCIHLFGCHSTGPKEAKMQADQHWDEMRAGVKLQLARQQADRGLFESALNEATAALALDPRRAESYVLAIEAHLELGQLASAERLLQTAQAAQVISPDLSYLAGVVHEQRGSVQSALGFFREARQANSHKVDYVLAEAECLVELDQPAEAMALLEANLNTLDEAAAVAALAGRIAALLGDDAKALAYYRLAFSRQPDSPVLAREFGILLAQHGRCPEATSILGELMSDGAEQLGPESRRAGTEGPPASVSRALAFCHLAADEPALAAEVLSGHLSKHPDDAAGQLLFAQAAVATRDDLGADRSLYLAEMHGAPRTKVLFLRGVLNWRQGNLPVAAGLLEQVLAIDPADSDASCLLGDVYAALGQADAAAEAFERALHASPSDAWAHSRLNRLSATTPAPSSAAATP